MYSKLCSSSCPFAQGECCATIECIGKSKLEAALRTHFKFQSFRPGQLDALLPLVHGKDVFLTMATGAGKSLCMFLAVLAMGESAIGIIVSPLNALMDQQVKQLNDIDVRAVRVGPSRDFFEDVAAGKYRFVFMAPETAVSSSWRELFSVPMLKQHLAVVAIDEAHCISEWGGDFRTCFRKLGGLRALTDVPFIALTATAPPSIKATICESLGLKEPIVVSQTLDRPNIYLSVRKSKGLSNDLAGIVSVLKNAKEALDVPKTIIFCQTKNVAFKLYRLLDACRKGSISLFHASLTSTTKSSVQENFQSSSSLVRVLVATIAFGMGMDITDVEIVVVYGVPETLSQFYQLCGRAGRSGSQARAHLFYSPTKGTKDPILKRYCDDKNTENCLRVLLLQGLGSSPIVRHNEACCAVCCNGRIPYVKLDIIKSGSRQYRKKPADVCDMPEALLTRLQEELKKEREKIMLECPSYRMLGFQHICPDSVITELCGRAKYITSLDHLTDISFLRPELKSRFYDILMNIVCDAPPPVKRRRR